MFGILYHDDGKMQRFCAGALLWCCLKSIHIQEDKKTRWDRLRDLSAVAYGYAVCSRWLLNLQYTVELESNFRKSTLVGIGAILLG